MDRTIDTHPRISGGCRSYYPGILLEALAVGVHDMTLSLNAWQEKLPLVLCHFEQDTMGK